MVLEQPGLARSVHRVAATWDDETTVLVSVGNIPGSDSRNVDGKVIEGFTNRSLLVLMVACIEICIDGHLAPIGIFNYFPLTDGKADVSSSL